jgi:hypothetical protein
VRYNGANSQYQITGQAGGTWYYRVRASNAAGYGAWSNSESVSVIPAAPVLQAIDNPDRDGEYLVDWNSATGATSYHLEEDDNPDFISPTVLYTGGDSQYQVSEQEIGRWYYRVRAGNAGGDSPWSNTQVVGVAPAAPVLNSIDNPEGDGEYLVDWDEVAEATSYVLEEDDNPDFTSPVMRYTGTGSQYQAHGQESGLWYYRVQAIAAGGGGLWSNIEMVGVVPAAPVLLPIGAPDGDRSYLVEWMDVSGATGYKLEEDDTPDFSSPITRYEGPVTQIEVAGQPAGTWYYRVRAYNSAGNGPWSATQSAALSFRVLLPLLLRASGGGQ